MEAIITLYHIPLHNELIVMKMTPDYLDIATCFKRILMKILKKIMVENSVFILDAEYDR